MSQQPDYGLIGLREQELREALEDELVRAIRAEGEVPTIHAIAHSVARVLELDHLRMAEQLRPGGSSARRRRGLAPRASLEMFG